MYNHEYLIVHYLLLLRVKHAEKKPIANLNAPSVATATATRNKWLIVTHPQHRSTEYMYMYLTRITIICAFWKDKRPVMMGPAWG